MEFLSIVKNFSVFHIGNRLTQNRLNRNESGKWLHIVWSKKNKLIIPGRIEENWNSMLIKWVLVSLTPTVRLRLRPFTIDGFDAEHSR